MSERLKIPDSLLPLHKEIIERAIERDKDDNHEVTAPNFDPISSETYRRVFKKLIQPGDKILNVGSGFAIDYLQIANYLNDEIFKATKEKKATLTNINLNREDLLSHKDLSELTHTHHVDNIQADGLQLPIADNSISGIVSSNVINSPHKNLSLQEQAKQIISEARRVLRPRGFLLLSSFGYVTEGRDGKGNRIYNNDLKKGDILTLRQLEKLLEETGFVDIADIEVDEERHELVSSLSGKGRSEEAGAFLAFKPAEKK